MKEMEILPLFDNLQLTYVLAGGNGVVDPAQNYGTCQNIWRIAFTAEILCQIGMDVFLRLIRESMRSCAVFSDISGGKGRGA